MTRSLGQLTLDLVAKTSSFTGPMGKASKQAERQFKQMERDAKKAARGIAKVTTAAAAATAGLVAYAKIGMDNVDAQAKLARSLETTIGDLRGISLAASDAGVEQGKLNSALMSYNKRLGDAVRDTGPAKKAYQELGIEADKLAKMPMAEQLALVAERINQLDSAAERQSIADALMSDGRNVVKLFESGGDAIRGAIDEVEGLGLAISDVDAAKVEEANDAISRIGLVSEAAQNAVAIGLAPALGDLADMLVEVAQAFQAGEYDRQIELLVDVGKVAAVAGTAYAAYRTALAAATIAQYAFNVAVRANPLMALVSAATAAVGAAYVFREELGLVDGVARRAEQALDGATGAIHDGSLAAINNSYDELSKSLMEVRGSAQEATLAVLELERAKLLYDKSHKGLASGAEAEIARQHGIQADAWEKMVELQNRQKELAEKREEIEKRISEVGSNRSGGAGTPPIPDGGGGSSTRSQTDAVNRVLQSLDLQVKMLGKTAEEQELYKLATEGATAAQLEQARAAQDTIAEFQAKQEALDDYRSLVDELRTSEELETDTLRERLAVLDAVAISQEEYNEAAKRAISGAVGDAPSFGGLDASIGGAFGELAKIDEAQEQLQEWYDTQLEMLAEFRAERADLTAEWDEQELALKQQHEDELARIENARQIAQLAAAESVFGDLADITRQFAGEQSGIYQAMFAVQKAAAIAQSIVAIQQGIAMAAANPWPANLAAMASVAAATAGIVSNIASIAMPSGQAHDGIDSVPADGTWNLQKGERVVTSQTSAKLDRTLDEVRRGRSSDSGGNVTVNLIENRERAGEVERETRENGDIELNAFVADIGSGGKRSRVLEQTYGLRRQGR